MTTAELAEIRERHVPDLYPADEPDTCEWCAGDWPCDAARLLDALDAERARILAAVEGLPSDTFIDDYGEEGVRPGTTWAAVDRAAVLAIVKGEQE